MKRGEAPGGGAARPLRADAQRNRARVLEAAESVFAAEGINVPVDVIAEKAGVGIGTLYRHFPTKEKLFEAILIGRIGDITTEARARVDADDPGAAFFGFLEDLVEETSSKRDLIQALLGAGVEVEEAVAETKRGSRPRSASLLHVAQRPGPSVPTSRRRWCSRWWAPPAWPPTAPQDGDCREMLNIVCDGLRPPNVARPTGLAAEADVRAPRTSINLAPRRPACQSRDHGVLREAGAVASTVDVVADPPSAEVSLLIGGMTCGACAARIERRLNVLDGVEARVNYASERATAVLPRACPVQRLMEEIAAAGYSAELPPGLHGPRPTGRTTSRLACAPCAGASSCRRCCSCRCATCRSPSPWHPTCGSPAGSG